MEFEVTENRGLNLLGLIQIIVKRKKIIILISCISCLAAVVYSLMLPNIYSSTAKVLIPQRETSSALSAVLGQAGGLAGLASGGFNGGSDLYIGILKSRSVADAVVQRLGLGKVYDTQNLEDTRLHLNQAAVFRAGKDGIITIIAEDKDPRRAADLANTFVDELGKATLRLNLSKAGSERLFLEKRLKIVKNDLEAAENELKAFSQRYQIVQPDSQVKATIEGISRLKADLAVKEVQLAALQSKQTEQSPEVKAARAAITTLQNELNRRAANSGVGGGVPAVGSMPGIGLEYSRKMRDLKTQEAIFEQLTKQYELVKMNEAKDSSNLQVLDEAVISQKKIRPARLQLVVTSVISAFFAAICLVLLLEYIDSMPDEKKDRFQKIKAEMFKL